MIILISIELQVPFIGVFFFFLLEDKRGVSFRLTDSEGGQRER